MTVNTDGVPRAAGLAALGVLAVLLATVDCRSYGLIPDGREMLSAGAAVARFFEIGVSRDFVNAPRRPGGDAVSRYGMGLSLVEAVPAAIARATGAARTSPLFVLVPVLCLAGCAWAAARTLGRLGAAPIPAAAGGAALVLATPLWGYAGSDYGEPLQALCVALSVLALVELREAPTARRWQVVLGAAAGFAILTKTLLVIVVAPLLLCALVVRDTGREDEDFLESNRAGEQPRGRAARRRAAGRDAPPAARFAVPWPLLLSFIGILLLWLFLEISRFGRLGGGYGGETFTYPFFTGLLRLTLLPNKGLLWYAPVSVLAVPGFLLLRRRDARFALALAASALALLSASAAWWAWDGQAGWGPRLVVPALPCFAVLAGVALAEGGRPWRVAGALALAAGVAVNALGALVPFPAVYALSSQIAPQPIREARAAGTPYEIDRMPDGTLRASAPHHLSLTPAWSPIRVHALALAARLKGAWDGSLPQLDPPFRPARATSPAPALRLATSPVRVGWGREFFEREEGERGESVDPYFDALRDQLVRAIDVRDFGRSASLGEELTKREEKTSANDPRTVALVAESMRVGGSTPLTAETPASGAPAALSYLSRKSSLLSSSSCHAWILFVRAMAKPPGDFACLPEAQRETFAGAIAVARQRGWTLTEWSRALTTGRP
ncbi:MAG: glycosyltransferase family 39 protein [Acidobacteriota bacterium]